MKILLIDPDQAVAQTLPSALINEGYQVEIAYEAAEGLRLAREGHWQLVISELNFPGYHGVGFVQEICGDSDAMLLVVSHQSSLSDRIAALDAGADDYLLKPVEQLELLARVRALLRRSGINGHQVLKVGDIELNTASKEARHRGQPVELTSREFDLAEVLARQRGRVLSRDYLFNHLFQRDELSPNLLDVYIYKLRRKLGTEFVKTKRGSGYLVP